jgi:hypothetical protein
MCWTASFLLICLSSSSSGGCSKVSKHSTCDGIDAFTPHYPLFFLQHFLKCLTSKQASHVQMLKSEIFPATSPSELASSRRKKLNSSARLLRERLVLRLLSDSLAHSPARPRLARNIAENLLGRGTPGIFGI